MSAAVAAAVGRVLDINPVLLRPDTPLEQFGCDSVALVAIADALDQSGTPVALSRADRWGQVTTFGDLLEVVGVDDD